MTNRAAMRVLATLCAVALFATGCTTTQGTPVAGHPGATTSPETEAPTTTSPAVTTSAPSPTPTGPPIGNATMRVDGGTAPVTIRYQINGGAEQIVTGVSLPWEKQYPVYNEIESSVTADGGATKLTCSIIMDGKLASLKTETRPTCSFAYYG